MRREQLMRLGLFNLLFFHAVKYVNVQHIPLHLTGSNGMTPDPSLSIARKPDADAIAPAQVKSVMDNALAAARQVVLGKDRQLRLALACIMARGHLLVEDIPGVGKTTLAHVLAKVLGLNVQRIQFTSDLLPSDIIGAAVFARDADRFVFHPGPLFAQLILADEVNRATPKCQSALLEAMEEHQVTVDGETHPLPQPFFVIATQNPAHQIGTFPLPESQLDRFLMRITMGYPDRQAERELLKGVDRRALTDDLPTPLDPQYLNIIQNAVPRIHLSEALLDYLQALIEFSRQSPQFAVGLSPRGGLALLRASQAWALLHGRGHVLPEDVQAVTPSVAGHRLQSKGDGALSTPESMAQTLLSVAIP